MNKIHNDRLLFGILKELRTYTQRNNLMSKVYLVKEIQYEWVKVLSVHSSKSKAEAHCNDLLKARHKPVAVINYIVEEHTVLD